MTPVVKVLAGVAGACFCVSVLCLFADIWVESGYADEKLGDTGFLLFLLSLALGIGGIVRSETERGKK